MTSTFRPNFPWIFLQQKLLKMQMAQSLKVVKRKSQDDYALWEKRERMFKETLIELNRKFTSMNETFELVLGGH